MRILGNRARPHRWSTRLHSVPAPVAPGFVLVAAPVRCRARCGVVTGASYEPAEITGIGQAAFKSRLHQARLPVRAVIGDQALGTASG
jgi:hypothetical protein